MKLIWLTDIHLNFIEEEHRVAFYQKIIQEIPGGVLITGDIAESSSLVSFLKEMSSYIQKPIYFILGNHDYYGSDIHTVRELMTQLTEAESLLHWLPASGIQRLNKNTALLGQDGWADGRLGNYQDSPVGLNDSRMIADLFQKKLLSKTELLKKMQELADFDAEKLKSDLNLAVSQGYKKIIVLTHIPPFKEACLHDGEISNDNWLPYFSSKATGDVLSDEAKKNPTIQFLVLCGHTHSISHYQPLDNLVVRAGHSEYGTLDTQKTAVRLLEERFILFMDILGTNELGREECKLDILLEIVEKFSQNNRTGRIENIKLPDGSLQNVNFNPEISSFSDHILISFPVGTLNEGMILLSLIHIAVQIHRLALEKRLLVRGAITIGSLYHEGNISIGEGLNKAVALEKEASAPRVMIDKNIIEIFRTHIDVGAIKKDIDEAHYINYLEHPMMLEARSNHERISSLTNVHKIIEKELSDTTHGVDGKEKWIWIAEKYNGSLKYYREKYNISLREFIPEITISVRKIQ